MSPAARVIRNLNRASGLVATALSVAAALGAVVIMITIMADVASRELGYGSLTGMVDTSELMLVIVTFLGMAQAERIDGHIKTSLVTERMRPAARRLSNVIAMVVYLWVVCWMADASLERAISSVEVREYRSGLANFPVYPARVAIAVGLIALAAMVFVRLLAMIIPDGKVPAPMDEGGVVS